MKPNDQGWQSLVAAARRVQDDRAVSAPYGFATRVAARALAGERLATRSVFDRFSWRVLGVAGLLAAVSVATSYGSLSNSSDEDVLSNDSAVAALFDGS